MSRTAWTSAQWVGFIGWHEHVIAQYPEAIREELRLARAKWMAGIPRLHS